MGTSDVLAVLGAIVFHDSRYSCLSSRVGDLMMGINLVVWKMDEIMRRVNEKLEPLGWEIKSFKASGGHYRWLTFPPRDSS